MSFFDFNDADQQRSGELIPDKIICKIQMTIRPGAAGPEGWLTPSNSSDAEYLNCEYTILEGPFANRKFWGNLVVSGGKQNDKGQSIAGEITRATLRAMLESSRNIQPSDMSDAACVKRRVESYSEFDGMIFIGKIGIEKGKDGYQDKNKLSVVITPDKKEYQTVMNGGTVSPASAPAGLGNVPPWASGPAASQQKTAAAQKSTIPPWAV